MKTLTPEDCGCYAFEPYHQPEKYNLQTIGDMDVGCGYEYDKFWIVKDLDDGKLYWAMDSGCSCPSPFEWIKALADFHGCVYDEHSFSQLENALKDWAMSRYTSVSPAKVADLLKAARAAL